MALSNILFMLLGAALVAIGVLASACADRIRGPRVTTASATRRSHAPIVVETEESVAKPRAPRAHKKSPPEVPEGETADGGEDVILALVAAGYKKPIATEATWACGAAERASIETWTHAALRRCARGGVA